MYDAAGNRISKTVSATNLTTVYVRDASGNVLSVYEKPASGSLVQKGLHIYGSSRLGMVTAMSIEPVDVSLSGSLTGTWRTFVRGEKLFELSNHLGNVLATVSDRKVQVNASGSVGYYTADVKNATDYYPFGMGMVGRIWQAGGYRYGFNGKENDNEVKGEGNQQDYGMRIYDPRIAKFLSVDPLRNKYHYTPYSFAGNKPIAFLDLDGLEEGSLEVWTRRRDEALMKNEISEAEYWAQIRAQGAGAILGGVIVVDVFVTKGKLTQTYLLSQGLGLMEHNRAKTPEGRAAQDERFKENGTDFIKNVGLGLMLGKGVQFVKGIFSEAKGIVLEAFGKLRNPAIVPGEGEATLIGYESGLASRKFTKFDNIKIGEAGDPETKFLWTIDKRGINVALEKTPAATARGFITHTNISETACAGGEVWFTGENSVLINAKSARFGGASMNIEQWNAAKAAWEKLGYKVDAAPFNPPVKKQ